MFLNQNKVLHRGFAFPLLAFLALLSLVSKALSNSIKTETMGMLVQFAPNKTQISSNRPLTDVRGIEACNVKQPNIRFKNIDQSEKECKVPSSIIHLNRLYYHNKIVIFAIQKENKKYSLKIGTVDANSLACNLQGKINYLEDTKIHLQNDINQIKDMKPGEGETVGDLFTRFFHIKKNIKQEDIEANKNNTIVMLLHKSLYSLKFEFRPDSPNPNKFHITKRSSTEDIDANKDKLSRMMVLDKNIYIHYGKIIYFFKLDDNYDITFKKRFGPYKGVEDLAVHKKLFRVYKVKGNKNKFKVITTKMLSDWNPYVEGADKQIQLEGREFNSIEFLDAEFGNIVIKGKIDSHYKYFVVDLRLYRLMKTRSFMKSSTQQESKTTEFLKTLTTFLS